MGSVVLFRPLYSSAQAQSPTIFPWGLACVAGPLVEKGFRVHVVDECVTPDWRDYVAGLLRNEQPLAVGVSSMTGEQLGFGLRLARFVREHSCVPLVWGGVHASVLPEQTARNELVDFAVAGEGEAAFAELVVRLAKGEDPAGIPGVFRDRDGIVEGACACDHLDLAALPEPPYDLFDMEQYVRPRPDLGARRYFELCTSRGCPHRCGFCYITAVHGRRWRALEAEEVLERVAAAVQRFGLDFVLFREDNFFANPKRVEAIARGLLDRQPGVRWAASARTDYFHRYGEDFVFLLARSGCARVTFGVESGSPRILEAIQKDITPGMVLDAVRKTRDAGIQGTYHFMAGFPVETHSDFMATCRLIDQVAAADRRALVRELTVFAPYPGAALVKACEELGYTEPDSLEGWVEMDWLTAKRPWISHEQARVIDTAQFLVARLCHPNRAVRTWAGWRWKQFLRAPHAPLPERGPIEAVRRMARRHPGSARP